MSISDNNLLNVLTYNIGSFISQKLSFGSEKIFIDKFCNNYKTNNLNKKKKNCYRNSIVFLKNLIENNNIHVVGIQEFRVLYKTKYDTIGELIIQNNNRKLNKQSEILLGSHYNDNLYHYQCRELYSNHEVISNNKIRDYFSVSDLLIQTYRSGSQSGVTPKAYYYETPILVSEINGLKEQIIKDSTGVTTKLNYDKISKKIIYCLNDNNQKKFILNIKKNKTKYSWDNFSKKLIESSNKIDNV